MATKEIIEEVETLCSLCGGRGYESNHAMTAGQSLCRGCQGRGYLVTQRTTRYERVLPEEPKP